MERQNKFEKLSLLFERLPGVGPRQAERLTYFIARADNKYIDSLIHCIKELKDVQKKCPKCSIIHCSQNEICTICNDPERDSDVIMIVEKEASVTAMENTNSYNGRYFVLNELIPISTNTKLEKFNINKLFQHIDEFKVKRIIFAFSIHPDAEHTIVNLSNALKEQYKDILIQTLGRGLSNGSELEYSDERTLKDALKNTTSI